MGLLGRLRPVSFRGSGSDPIIDKPANGIVSPYYQYHLGVTGNLYPNYPSNYGFAIDVNNTYTFVNSVGNPPYVIGSWYHIVNTYDGLKIRMYINSTCVDSLSVTSKLTDLGQNLFIGRSGNYNSNISNYNYLPGNIGEIRIYNRALSQAEITNLYKL